MAVISTSLHTISNVVKHEYGADYAYCRQLVTVNDTKTTLLSKRLSSIVFT